MQRPVVVLDYRLSPGAYVLPPTDKWRNEASTRGARRDSREVAHGGTLVYHLSQCGSRCRYLPYAITRCHYLP